MKHLPGSTYRLQFHKGFTFDDAAAIADYLKQLGITHVYSSPYLQAVPGSMHGYDVVDHRRVNEELGGEEAHERFCKHLGEMGLGQVLDIVPNHMSLGDQNRYWWDVLENGTNSLYASFFDIDWNSSEERLRDKVLVPILPDQYGRILGAGGITLTRKGRSFAVEAAGQALPVAPETLAPLLLKAAEYARSDTLNFLAESYERLPSLDVTDRRTALARHRDKLVLHRLLQQLCNEEDDVREAIDRTLAELNTDLDALDAFLSRQNYRIAYWKTADQQLGYRRFFDVNTLIGLRQERDYVFDETHALLIRWLRQGVIDGVRVDHPDGLRDPTQYFRRLREKAPEAWIVGEKVLEPGEWMREDWPVEGTSGYDFLNQAMGVLIEPEGLKQLGKFYVDFTGDDCTFSTLAHEKKLAVEQEALGSDVNRLTNIFVEICESHREQRDFTRAEIRRAIREVVACFSVYRTYVVPDRGEIVDEDRHRIGRAIECAKHHRQDIDALLFDFMGDVLELKVTGNQESEFVYRFQQFTGPVMAKGVEDTAFYCYNRLVAMNEVGGDPDCEGVRLKDFHTYNERMQQTFPSTMVTLSTHDTKRSDDVRARLAVLSENPEAFFEAVQRWSELARQHDKGRIIDRSTEWFLFQTLVGVWPIDGERLRGYMQKAMREAKIRTSWTTNNVEYESALSGLIDGLLGDQKFIACLKQFVPAISYAGRINSLTQTLIKHTVPGVPDLYQGGELWDLSLVDPDNRRPVDYELRRRLLAELDSLSLADVMERSDEGLPKLWTIHQALRLRNEHPEWFGRESEYKPVFARGPQAERVIAYLRGTKVLTVAQRWVLRGNEWGETSIDIPEGSWRNRLTGERITLGGNCRVKNLFARFPVALLARLD
jgi:(1->4)-alpha-D-glucan 1-alpha-D-glucosylmutase